MGINVISNTSTQEVRGVAAATIAAGDLVTNLESGSVAPASTSLTIAQNNNTTAGPSAISAVDFLVSGTYYGNQTAVAYSCMAQMSNGVIAYSYTGNGANNVNSNLTLAFKNLQGGNPYPSVIVTGSTAYVSIVRSIPSVGAIVVWNDGSVRFAIYSLTGTEIKANTQIASTSVSSGNTYYNANVLTNNNTVIAYRKTTSNNLAFSIYDTTGTIVGTEVTVEASVNAQNIVVTPQSNGGFVIMYYTSGGVTKFARYNASGTLQGSITTLGSTSSYLTAGNTDLLCTELANGNLLFVYANPNAFPVFQVYTSAGVQVKSQTGIHNATYDDNTYNTIYVIPGIAKTASGFTFVSKGNNTTFYFSTFDNSGSNILALKATTYSVSTSQQNYSYHSLYAFSLGSSIAVYFGYGSWACGPLDGVVLFCFNSTSGANVGSGVTIRAQTSGIYYYAHQAILTADQSIALGYVWQANNSQIYFGTYAVQRKSIIGVAQEAIATNSSGRIATIGTYTTNQTFAISSNFDQRTATIPGTKGTVVSNSVVMYGMN